MSLPMIADSEYEMVYSIICLQHICVHSVRHRIMSEIYRVLKFGGIFSFQMGYGSGHPQPTGYEVDFTDAKSTNGLNDVIIIHPYEPIKDLISIGFCDISFSIQPVCPGDSHSAWIFLQAKKTKTKRLTIKNGNKLYTIEEIQKDYNYFKKAYFDFSINKKVKELEKKIINDQNIYQEKINSLNSQISSHQNQLDKVINCRLKELSYLCKNNDLHIVLFGGGEYADMLFQEKKILPEYIHAIYDNDCKFWGKKKFSVPIHNPMHLIKDQPDVIIISSKAYAVQIESELKQIFNSKTLIINLFPE
jgi:hypothetical protein